uniref:Uncharacterized protein n=1 Tax=Utricularia reniformis TaxID=192314 RepID=A0A1Y0B083_9LAMI|nr:hypothetical protein AEK19_MT0555 [Utricularia reniformis]ART30810.1 hypothetical protein AEK19_MT0555 [Utricularia reniformis]
MFQSALTRQTKLKLSLTLPTALRPVRIELGRTVALSVIPT